MSLRTFFLIPSWWKDPFADSFVLEESIHIGMRYVNIAKISTAFLLVQFCSCLWDDHMCITVISLCSWLPNYDWMVLHDMARMYMYVVQYQDAFPFSREMQHHNGAMRKQGWLVD